jgi:Lipocalin-like domain
VNNTHLSVWIALFKLLNQKEYRMMLRRRSLSVVAGAALFVAIAFSGCGDKSNPVSAGGGALVGTWNMTTATAGGVTMTAGTTTMTEVMTLNSNDTYRSIMVQYMYAPVTADTEVGTYSVVGNKVITTPTATNIPDTVTYSLAGTTLTVTSVDNTQTPPLTTVVVFAKQ